MLGAALIAMASLYTTILRIGIVYVYLPTNMLEDRKVKLADMPTVTE